MFGYCLLRCWHGDGLPKRPYRQPAEGNGSHTWSLDSWLRVWWYHSKLYHLHTRVPSDANLALPVWTLLFAMLIAQNF